MPNVWVLTKFIWDQREVLGVFSDDATARAAAEKLFEDDYQTIFAVDCGTWEQEEEGRYRVIMKDTNCTGYDVQRFSVQSSRNKRPV